MSQNLSEAAPEENLAAQLVGCSAKVLVPATSANLGPGYDSAGIALALFDELEATILDSTDLQIEIEGEGSDSLARDGSHLVVRALARGLAEFGIQTQGLALKCTNRIPHGRGLGSSSAAIVGGLALARELLSEIGCELSDQRLLELANDIEGHPDNVAPAIFGGFTIAWQKVGRADGSDSQGDLQGVDKASDKAGAVKVEAYVQEVHPNIEPVVAIPTSALATERARELMPNKVPLSDAAENAAAASLLSLALTHNPELLIAGTSDRLHQYYRRFAYPDSYVLVRSLRKAGIPAAISGAGPAVIAFGVAGTDLDGDALSRLVTEHVSKLDGETDFDVLTLAVDADGVMAAQIGSAG